MLLFQSIIDPQPEDVILDVGGQPHTWTACPQIVERIICLNTHPNPWDEAEFPGYNISIVVGNGCNLKYKDASHNILFSNSVIEHVGDWKKQCAFAREVRRVGRSLWIQTPAFECPLEPHFLAPFVHWLPVALRRRILRWLTPWGWIKKPSQEMVDKTIAYTRLLTKRQMTELFPDCRILTERLFWVLPKSYIAVRLERDTLK